MAFPRILLGDNQFFGVNHNSEQKAWKQQMQFSENEPVVNSLRHAAEAGVEGFMFTTHDRVYSILRLAAEDPTANGLSLIPCIPYAQKYSNAAAEMGALRGLLSLVGTSGALRAGIGVAQSSITGSSEPLIKTAIDAELSKLDQSKFAAVFLQNAFTDLAVGMNAGGAIRLFYDRIRERYGVPAGFITMNYGLTRSFLIENGMTEAIVCAPINVGGFRMAPSRAEVEESLAAEPHLRTVAMSVLASGGLLAGEAFDYVARNKNIDSVVFGASTQGHIKDSVERIREGLSTR